MTLSDNRFSRVFILFAPLLVVKGMGYVGTSVLAVTPFRDPAWTLSTFPYMESTILYWLDSPFR